MGGLIRKPDDLVLDRGAVAGADALDDARKHRRAVSRGPNDLVSPLVRLRNETINLSGVITAAPEEREDRHGLIARLRRHDREIERAPVDPWGSAGFEATDAQRQLTKARR